jgi:hypothetical protein
MPTYRIQHAYEGIGGTSRDWYSNTFYVFTGSQTVDTVIGASTLGEVLRDNIIGFYVNTSGGDSTYVKAFMSARTNGVETVRIYDLEDPPDYGPRFAFMGDAFDSPDDVVPLPEEVAVCLSYSALHTGANIKRRRGRIYIGPLASLAIDHDAATNLPVRVSPVLAATLLNAASRLQFTMNEVGCSWRVYSRMDGFAFDIVQASIDNSFDTVRGRGCAPTVRQLASVP